MLSQCHDQEGNTLDDHSKTSILDTPSLTIQIDRYMEATRVHFEACSCVTNPAVDIPREEQPSGQVAPGDGSVIHADKQATNGKCVEIKADGT